MRYAVFTFLLVSYFLIRIPWGTARRSPTVYVRGLAEQKLHIVENVHSFSGITKTGKWDTITPDTQVCKEEDHSRGEKARQ